jgi:hypothetical protein
MAGTRLKYKHAALSERKACQMRSKTSLAAVIVAVFIGGAATTPSAGAAPPADACLLLTQTQMSAALAVSMAAGSHTTPEYLKTCTWAPSGGPTQSLKFVTLDLRPAEGFEDAKKMLEQMKPKNVTMTAVSGIGDDAYYTTFGGTITNLMVKKGNISFKLAMYGVASPDKAMAMEKVLATQILSKF